MKSLSEKSIRILKTTALYLLFFALGLCGAIPGPTLLDLEQIVQADTGKTALIYLARSISALFGSLVGGAVFDFIQKPQLLLSFCGTILAASMFAIPWSRSLVILIVCCSFTGIALGTINTGANVMCIRVWEKQSPPYLHGLHFVVGVGTLLAPLIAEPFLSNCGYNEAFLQTNWTSSEELLYSYTTQENGTVACEEYTIPPITYAYSLIGAITSIPAICLLCFAILFPDRKKTRNEESDYDKTLQKHSRVYTIAVALTAQLLLFWYCSIEIGYGQMLVTFAVKGDLKLSKSSASFINALYWGSYTFFRGSAIAFTYKFPAFALVVGDLIVILLSTIILIAFGNTYVEALWVGSFLLGAGCSSFFPAVISWVESHVHVNNKIVSLFAVSACVGEMVVPLVVSEFIKTEPHMLLYICLGCSLGGCITAFCLWVSFRRKRIEFNYIAEDANITL